MNEPSTDELLSAYLDGELTVEEQARAERLLAEDPQARRLHAELRAMRTCLQGVSPQQLPDDFSGRVLRAAAQRMLAEPMANPAANEAQAEHAAWQERVRRPLAYALIVLAASVLIAVFAREMPQDNEQPVARAPGPQATSPEPPPTMSNLATDNWAEGFGKSTQPSTSSGPFGDQVHQDKLDDMAEFDGSLLVVTCEITPDAARKDAFRQVLAKNQIGLGLGENEGDGRDPARAAPREVAPGLQTAKKAAGAESGLEMVYVEATKEQLEATLTEISKKKEDFLSVDVGPTESQVAQNRWQRDYNRGRGNLVQQRLLLQAEDASGTVPTNPVAAAGATAPPTDTKQPAGNVGQQTGGRARGYSMPSDGLATQRAKALGGEEQVDRTRSVAKGGAALGKDGANPTAEPGTLRALFVLRVAEDQKPAAEAAKPAAATEPAKPAAPRP